MGPVNSFDFVERSQRIIQQYDCLNLPPEEHYDVTLLLNACVGLLFIAHEEYNGKIPNKMLRIPTWGIDPNQIKCCRRYDEKKKIFKNERISLRAICKHIRNSIAHCRFELKTDAADKVDRIYFEDRPGKKDRGGKKNRHGNDLTFDLTISLSDFQNFTNEVSQHILNLRNQLTTQKTKI